MGEAPLPLVPEPAAPPHVTLTVTRSGSPEARPVLEASVAGIAALEDAGLLEKAAAESGDLERCVGPGPGSRTRRNSASLPTLRP